MGKRQTQRRPWWLSRLLAATLDLSLGVLGLSVATGATTLAGSASPRRLPPLPPEKQAQRDRYERERAAAARKPQSPKESTRTSPPDMQNPPQAPWPSGVIQSRQAT